MFSQKINGSHYKLATKPELARSGSYGLFQGSLSSTMKPLICSMFYTCTHSCSPKHSANLALIPKRTAWCLQLPHSHSHVQFKLYVVAISLIEFFVQYSYCMHGHCTTKLYCLSGLQLQGRVDQKQQQWSILCLI